MSLLKSFTGVSTETVTFRKNVSAIEININSVLAGGTLDINNFLMSIYIQSTKKSKRLTFHEVAHAIDIAECSTMFKGRRIILTKLVVPTVDTTVPSASQKLLFPTLITNAKMQIDLTDGLFGVQTDGQDDIIIEFSNLDTNARYEITGVEEDANGVEAELKAYKYDILSTKQERNSKFSAVNINRFAVERSLSFDSVEIGFKDGTNIKLSQQDLDGQAEDTFGNCYETETFLAGANIFTDLMLSTHVKARPERNFIIPMSGNELYMQVNVKEVSGSVSSLRVISVTEQNLHA